MQNILSRIKLLCLMLGLASLFAPMTARAVVYPDNETQYSNQDMETETRRSDHFRTCFGHYNRDSGMGGMTEAMAQGNLQMFEQEYNRIVVEMGMHNFNESTSRPDMGLRKANFNFLMTWNDGGGGGAYMSSDGNGFPYAMANPASCRWDPPSGATPHEMGHVWEGATGGFNGTDSSGMWWECTANWIMLQFNNTYPQPGAYIYNAMFYPAHGRDFYDSYMIWETAREDFRYGAAWVNEIWTNATPSQRNSEFIIDRMARLDTSGSPDKMGAMRDLWGDMTKKLITFDYERQRWLATANKVDDGTDWEFYMRCRTPLLKLPGSTNLYRPCREYIPVEYGFHFVPLTVTAGTTVSCDFQPLCDPVRQSDWRACLVAVNTSGVARYSVLWNKGNNSISLAADETKLYLTVIATPKPMKIADPMWAAYTTDAGVQFPYTLSLTNATPKNAMYPVQSHTGMTQHANGGGWKATTATVDATAYLGPNAQVLNTAQVKSYARIEDYAVVRNSAQVRDYAVVSGHAMIEGNAKVYGNAKVRDWARLYGYAEVYENAKAIEHGYCGDGNNTTHNKILGNAIIKGVTSVYDTSLFTGSLICDGDTANGNGLATTADHGVHFGWQWGQNVSIFPALVDNVYIYAQHNFERDNAVFAMDNFGINHGYLMNGARVGKDTVAPTRGGRVLPLDGVSQYVELHNSVNDFRETAICAWIKCTVSTPDQRIWSMGDGANKYMYLTPVDDNTGKLRFVISDGTTTQYLDGATAVPANTWTHVAVGFDTPVFNTTTKTWSATGRLYVNGAEIASLAGMIVPDSLNAPLMENANYLGRGNSGNYFQGYVDDFRVYMKSLTAAEISAVYTTAAPGSVTITADTAAPTGLGWLVAPNAAGLTYDLESKMPEIRSDNAITMSANPGTDASGWVEYYFTCTAGGGHDSGWVSFNKYTDVGLSPGTTYTYTVKMRDKNGNTTAASSALSATTATSTVTAGSFSYGPIGISTTSIMMTATKVINSSGRTEYRFYRSGVALGNWQTSSTYTDTGRTPGSSYTYTVQMRDGRGNVGVESAPVTAVAKDSAAPLLPIAVAHWGMLPYSTIDNKISMTAQSPTTSDATGIQYYFHCTSGGAPDSAWQTSATYVTPAMADGAYTFQYKVRDKTALNESPYSTSYTATVTPTTGYHSCTLAQLAAMPDDNLVSFSGTVMKVNAKDYYVKDLASGASIKVKGNNGKTDGTSVELTNAALSLKNVSVKGHLYTYGGVKMVTFATVASTGDPVTYAVSGKVTTTTGVGIAGATVYFSDVANPAANAIVTATTDASGNYSKGVTNGTWFIAAGAGAYNTSATVVQVVNGVPVANVNFTLVANATISGKVTKKSDGTGVAGAKVYFSTSPSASANPTFTATADASGNYTQAVQNTSWYVCAGGTGFYMTSDKVVTVNGANVTNVDLALKASTRNIPRTADLLFSAVTESLPASGAAGNWATYMPSGQTLTAIGTPTVEILNGMKWVRNLYADGDGFRQATYAAPIAVNGATIVAAVKPLRNTTGTSWTSVVDIFYDRLVLGVINNTGKVIVRRNGSNDQSSTAIPDGQTTILTLIVQPDGTYKVWANGVLIMNITTTSAMTSLVNGVAGGYANNINVGRNEPDGWTTYNGNIGDVFVYKVALTDVVSTGERQQIEADLYNKFMTYNITATADTGGSVSPLGVTAVDYASSQAYTITPNAGYTIASVLVDGISQGAITSYTFTNVLATHTISATFTAQPIIISASAGTGGSISPTGAVSCTYGTSRTFTMTPSAGYAIANVMIDGEPYGAISTYTFTNITIAHTISVTFNPTSKTITASAGANGSVTPSGAVSVNSGASQIFTFSPSAGYGIIDVKVDGASITPLTTYTFTNVTANHTISASFAKLIGMNNKAALTDGKVVGKVIKVWGKIKNDNKPTTFTIDDGYGTPITVNINGAALPAGFGVDKTVVVTGLLKSDKIVQAQIITIY